MNFIIQRADPAAEDVRALVAAHVTRSRKHYAIDACHAYDSKDLAGLGVALFVGRSRGTAAVIGGLLPLDAKTVEMKSVFTADAARGQGFGRLMVEHLINQAQAAGYADFVLETGSDAPSSAARALYEKLGFHYCPPFGSFVENPLSVFMTKPL